MKIGLLGTGQVGTHLGGVLVGLGHEVMLGSRTAGNETAVSWVGQVGAGASTGTFADAGAHGDLLINAVGGANAVVAVSAAAERARDRIVLIDLSNPLDWSGGAPIPAIAQPEGRSLGEAVQSAAPNLRVVKALNTVNHQMMTDPGQVPGDHVLFLCGDDAAAKDEVRGLLAEFGWRPEQLMDLGDLVHARSTELYLPLWVSILQKVGGPNFGITVTTRPE